MELTKQAADSWLDIESDSKHLGKKLGWIHGFTVDDNIHLVLSLAEIGEGARLRAQLWEEDEETDISVDKNSLQIDEEISRILAQALEQAKNYTRATNADEFVIYPSNACKVPRETASAFGHYTLDKAWLEESFGEDEEDTDIIDESSLIDEGFKNGITFIITVHPCSQSYEDAYVTTDVLQTQYPCSEPERLDSKNGGFGLKLLFEYSESFFHGSKYVPGNHHGTWAIGVSAIAQACKQQIEEIGNPIGLKEDCLINAACNASDDSPLLFDGLNPIAVAELGISVSCGELLMRYSGINHQLIAELQQDPSSWPDDILARFLEARRVISELEQRRVGLMESSVIYQRYRRAGQEACSGDPLKDILCPDSYQDTYLIERHLHYLHSSLLAKKIEPVRSCLDIEQQVLAAKITHCLHVNRQIMRMITGVAAEAPRANS